MQQQLQELKQELLAKYKDEFAILTTKQIIGYVSKKFQKWEQENNQLANDEHEVVNIIINDQYPKLLQYQSNKLLNAVKDLNQDKYIIHAVRESLQKLDNKRQRLANYIKYRLTEQIDNISSDNSDDE